MATHRDLPASYLDGPPREALPQAARGPLTARGRVLGVEPLPRATSRPGTRATRLRSARDAPAWAVVLVLAVVLAGLGVIAGLGLGAFALA